MSQAAINKQFNNYCPDGLKEWIELKEGETNNEGKKIIDDLELMISKHVIMTLKNIYKTKEDEWLYSGVPKKVIAEARNLEIEHEGKRKIEQCFNLLHYKKIIDNNWNIFKEIYSINEKGTQGKEKGLAWFDRVNNMRNIVSHVSANEFLTHENVSELKRYDQTIKERIIKHNSVNA